MVGPALKDDRLTKRSPPFFYYLYRWVEPQFNDRGELKPEIRLQPAMVGAFFIPVCLFWFGWSARPSIHWIMPIIGSSFFAIGTFLLFNSVLNYLGDAYPDYAASVLAGNDFMRSCFGAGFPLFATAMYKNEGVGWASSILGFLAIVFIPIPFVLYKVSYPLDLRCRTNLTATSTANDCGRVHDTREKISDVFRSRSESMAWEILIFSIASIE